MPTCCRIQLCCDPPGAAADLADHHDIPIEAAEKILAAYQLVPRTADPGSDGGGQVNVKLADKLLASAVRVAREQIEVALTLAGHSVKRIEPQT